MKIEKIIKEIKKVNLCLCDFGFGIQRYDIDKICILEDIGQDGSYKGLSLGVDFDFSMKAFKRLDWTQKVKKFLGWR